MERLQEDDYIFIRLLHEQEQTYHHFYLQKLEILFIFEQMEVLQQK